MNKLASAILRGNWLMDYRTAMGYLPLAERFLNGEKISFFDNTHTPESSVITLLSATGKTKIAANQSANATNLFADADEGSVVVIPVQGTIMAEDDCWGTPGTNTMGNWMLAAAEAENVAGIVLQINSGGGTVEGTAEFAQIIAAVAAQKPVEAFVDGMACSAAYWLASACNKITASSGTVEFGSIGTAISFKDYSKMYAENGINPIYINADDSIDKNQDVFQAIAGNAGPIRENVLNPTNDIFLQAVQDNRLGKLQLSDRKDAKGKVIGQEPLTGKTYIAQKAIENGLIDAIGTMSGVVASVQSSANTSNLIAKTNKKNMGLFGSDFPKLNSLKDKKAGEISTEEITAVNEELAAKGIENIAVISATHVAEADANADAIANTLTTANTALGKGNEKPSLNEAVTALVADRDAQKLLAETYGKQPGAMGTKPDLAAEDGEAQSEGGENMDDAPKEMSSWEIKANQKKQAQKPKK